ncbi:hypothetical protein P12x_003466 [Tundrisphaera lichenicola]|uniref:hypothetical protein n=1 Tax=Tundrisphaera lichenicola TaxID=2029860 RepID=UPI003EBDFFAA
MLSRRQIPSYRLHKATGQAIVVLRGRSYYLGKFGTTQSRAEYNRVIADNRVIAEYLANGGSAPQPKSGPAASTDLTIDELILRYWRFAEGHYARDGLPGRELASIRDAIRPLRQIYGQSEAARFGPLALKAVRKAMIDAGLCRNTINSRVGKIRRMFKWAVADELIPPGVLEGLKAVGGLQRGKGGARESEPVRPVSPEHVEAVLPFVSKPVRAMIQVQQLIPNPLDD